MQFYAVILRRAEEYARSMRKELLMQRNADTVRAVRSFGNAHAFISPRLQKINGHRALSADVVSALQYTPRVRYDLVNRKEKSVCTQTKNTITRQDIQ